jgi:site-specific recombinase XerD
MTVDVFVRHSTDCAHQNDRYWKRCKCRKWLYVGGSRKPISAKTRSWDKASEKAREIETEYNKREQTNSTPASSETPPSPSTTKVKTVREAVTAFLEDKQEQNVSKNWLQKYRRELPNFASWCERKVRYIELAQVDLIGLEDYRKTWTGAPATRRKRQERLRSLFRYCIRHRWIYHNVAADLQRIQTKTPPKLPLTREQFSAVMAAVESYHPRGRDSQWRRMRAMTMLLLLRCSGLRINDAAKLERIALTDSGSLRLYMQKTGEPVYVPLPPELVTLLRELRNPDNPRYFFWNGTSDSASPGIRWWCTLKTIFQAAGLPDAHPHMLRDTFAVEMLVAGVPIDQVSMLLGHSSVKITEKHYLPWVRARQRQLEESVRKVWAADPLSLTLPTAQVSVSIN